MTVKSPHSRVLDHLIKEYRTTLLESLTVGLVVDYAGFRHMLGRIQGLDDALKLSEEADSKLNGDNPDGSR